MPDPIDAELCQLIDDMPAMLAAFDHHGRSAYRNHACRAFFGLGNDEAGGKCRISDLVFENNPAIKERLDSGSEVRLVRELSGSEDTRRFEISIIPSVSPGGNVHGYVAIARDAPDDGDTAKTGDSSASLLDSLPDGVLLFDSEGRLRHANSRFDIVWPAFERPFEPGAGLDRTLQTVMRHACPESPNRAWEDDLLERIRSLSGRVTEIRMQVADRTLLCRITRTGAGGTMLSFSAAENLMQPRPARREMTDDLIDAVARQMPGLIGQIDADGRYVFANRACSEWYGVADDMIIGLTDEELIAILPTPGLDEAWCQRRRTNFRLAMFGETVEFEEVRNYPDGHERHVRGAVIPSFDHDGSVRGVSLVTIDISEERRREKALIESEERYRSLVELSPDYIMVHRDGVCLFANPATNSIYGLEPGRSMVGKNVIELVHPDSRAAVIDRYKMLLGGDGPLDRIVVKSRRRDGSEIDLEAQVAKIYWDGKPAYLVVGSDISERNRAEGALRDSEERYRSLAQLLPDAVRVVTGDTIVYANAAAAELLGIESPEQLSGYPGQYFLHPADLEVTSDRMARVDRGEHVPWREHSLRALGGEEVTVESAIAPIVWNGKPSRLLVSRDTSRHKRIEMQLRHAMEDAKQANVAKSRFLAAASHDLRQPIQALGLLNAAMAYEADTPSLKEITSNMGHAIEAMRSVLDGLLDISKLEAGVVTPEFSVFPVAPIFDRIAGELSLEAHAKGLEMRVVPSSLYVRSDRDLLERIVQNFASNAIRYTNSGRVLIGCRRRESELHLQIWDTGPGIGPDQQERIFEEFYQLENPARDRSKGLGLGLAIVERLARLLGHPIQVRSVPGLGSMFSVVLPIEADDGMVVERRDPLPAIELDGRRILVLDDDKGVVEATMALLSRWGAEVMGAHTADDALRLASAPDRQLDLVIVDYLLSDGETGTDVIRRLDETLGYCAPRIVISGDVSTRIISEVRSAGSVLLHKPVNPAKLRSLIHHLLPSGS